MQTCYKIALARKHTNIVTALLRQSCYAKLQLVDGLLTGYSTYKCELWFQTELPGTDLCLEHWFEAT